MFTTQTKTKSGQVLKTIENEDLAGVWKTEFEQRMSFGVAIGKVGVVTKDEDGHIVARHTHDDDTGRWLGPFEDEGTEAEALGFE